MNGCSLLPTAESRAQFPQLLPIDAPKKRKIGGSAMCERESVGKAWAIFPLLLGNTRSVRKIKQALVTAEVWDH